jgi:hypothetical protein
MPLLYWGLQTACAGAVPRAALDELQRHFRANAQRNLFLAGTLRQLLSLLEAHGIPAIPYKGPVLAVAVYGNLALRQFGDLDILIRPQDAGRAQQLLFSQGYHWWDGRPHTLLPRLRKVSELVSADGRVLVELHYAITSATFLFPLNPAHLWARLETVSLLDTPVRTLAPEDLLLILCVHGAKHHWGRLGWICDVAALLRTSGEMNWERLVAYAGQLGSQRMLCLGVFLAHTLLGTVLPDALRPQLQADSLVQALAAQVSTELFAAAPGPLSAVERPLFYLRLRERLRDRVQSGCYLAYRLLTSPLLPPHKHGVEAAPSRGKETH